MHFLDTLERRFGGLAIPGLIRYVVALNALVFLLIISNPSYADVLNLNRAAILNGEIWRLVSWIFVPNTTSFFWILFYLMFTWWCGDMLESAWGTFRLNVYYFTGMIVGTLAVFVFGGSGQNYFLNLSLLFALATIAPNQQVLFLIFPVKLKWVALLSFFLVCVLPLLSVRSGLGLIVFVAFLLFSFLNYILFFGPALIRNWKDNKKVQERRARFEMAKIPEEETLHKCFQCGRTEASHPNLDFRVASDGHEYCSDHLKR